MEGSQHYEGWRLAEECVADGIPVRKFKSSNTGLTVAMADIEGPLVYGYFVLATEAHDNFGLPHTLEHAIFLGSEDYPYKGVLDSLANRCLARGTNAWTDVDHTCYTIEVAGSEGFLNILPVYLDHILFPTLTNSGFYTEVHHIDGEGVDAGVVYCEMQARENTGPSIMFRTLLEALYPGDCGYKYETGGMMADLRKLTADQVRQYHKDFYRIDNLCLIINGKVSPKAVFDAIRPIEEKVKSKAALPPMTRPWSSPVPPFTTTVEQIVPFPADEETTGAVMLGWRGPSAEEFAKIAALDALWEYLTDSAVSPLRHAFVDIPDPYCTSIRYSYCENSVYIQYLKFSNVPTAKLGLIKDKLFEVLEDLIEKGIDMERMATVIKRLRLKHLSDIETEPHESFALEFIVNFLYSKEGQLAQMLDKVKQLKELEDKDSQFWVQLLKETLIEQPYCLVVGQPSKEKAAQLASEEVARIEAQRKHLGKAKLEELSKKLEDAVQANEVEIPTEELEKFPIPNVSNIPFIPIYTYCNHNAPTTTTEGNQKLRKHILDQVGEGSTVPPFFIQFDHIPSVFMQIKAFLDTSSLPDHLRPFLELYLEAFFEVPIVAHDGREQLSHEDVVKQLTNDTVSYYNGLGIGDTGNFSCGRFAQAVVLSMKGEVSKYERIIQWLRDFLWNSRFTKERLIIAAQKLINDVAQHKRKGAEMVIADSKWINFDSKKSNHGVTNLIKQHRFLTSVLEQLEKDEKSANEVCEQFEEFRKILCHPQNLRVQVSANILSSLPNPLAPWLKDFLPSSASSSSSSSSLTASSSSLIPFSDEYRTRVVKEEGNLLALAAIESSYLVQTGEGPAAFDHPDIAPLLVLIEYLTTMEGPFWKHIRGAGLSYSYDVFLEVEEGLIYFLLFRSASLCKAYDEAIHIVNDYHKKNVEFEETLLDAARSSVIFGIIAREETASSAAAQSFLNCLCRVPHDENKRLLERVKAVTVEDLYRVLEKYFTVLFDASRTNISIASNPSNVTNIKRFFEGELSAEDAQEVKPTKKNEKGEDGDDEEDSDEDEESDEDEGSEEEDDEDEDEEDGEEHDEKNARRSSRVSQARFLKKVRIVEALDNHFTD
ncbi:putative zn2+-dependent endopeptidase insulinase superfamily protein [Balamuthia mandrillaris]